MALGRRHRLSIIVPVGPGDALAPPLAATLRGLAAAAEIVVVTAGVDEAGPEPPAVFRPGWRNLAAGAGRARQQNAGARAAGGDHLWFLHADSRFGERTLAAAVAQIERGELALAYFDLRFADGPGLMRINEWGAWLRSRWLGLPFGDQGFLMPRRLFEALGGFDERLPAGEDHDLVWRARAAAYRLRAMRVPLLTSARKYRQRGWLRTTVGHLQATIRQALDFSVARSE